MMDDEAEALERTAEWRRRNDAADAAAVLERLAVALRALGESPVTREYVAICNWLGESGEIADFHDMAQDYRSMITPTNAPVSGEAYLRALVTLAKQSFGA